MLNGGLQSCDGHLRVPQVAVWIIEANSLKEESLVWTRILICLENVTTLSIQHACTSSYYTLLRRAVHQQCRFILSKVKKLLLVVLHREVVVVIIVLDVWMAWRWRRLHG